jgi:dihydrofolate reductase
MNTSRIRVASFSISLDGFGAGIEQSLQRPLGKGAEACHQWVFPTRTFQKKVLGKEGGSSGVDDQFAARGFENLGAWILGRNMFGPVRGAWPDESWKGWWGDEPPYHCPVFVLTHHPRASLAMKGGTVFHFVTGGMHEALARAREAAQGKDVRIGGGVATIRQYLHAGLIDEMHLVLAPVLLGQGEHLLQGIDLLQLSFEVAEQKSSDAAMHVVLHKRTSPT